MDFNCDDFLWMYDDGDVYSKERRLFDCDTFLSRFYRGFLLVSFLPKDFRIEATQNLLLLIFHYNEQAGLFPALIFSMSVWYTRSQLTKRIAIVLMQTTVASVNVFVVISFQSILVNYLFFSYSWFWKFRLLAD